MVSAAAPRPAKLFRYAPAVQLERALKEGEFRLLPASEHGLQMPVAPQILPFGASRRPGALNYLTLSLATAFDERLFDEYPGAEGCLVILDTESFGERIHLAAQRALPNWAGIDSAIAYGVPSPLGAAFSKEKQMARQKEYLFAWRPIHASMAANPVTIRIGSIESIAELRPRPDR